MGRAKNTRTSRKAKRKSTAKHTVKKKTMKKYIARREKNLPSSKVTIGSTWLHARVVRGKKKPLSVCEVTEVDGQTVKIKYKTVRAKPKWVDISELQPRKTAATQKKPRRTARKLTVDPLPAGGWDSPCTEGSNQNVSFEFSPKKEHKKGKSLTMDLCTPKKCDDDDVNELSMMLENSALLEDPEQLCMEDADREQQIRLAQEALITRDIPHRMSGRSKQLDEVKAFIKKHLEDGTSHSLYICGSPGTGKTATLLQTRKLIPSISREAGVGKTIILKLNGFEMTAPNQIYPALLEKVTGRAETMNAAKASEKLKEIFMRPHKMKTRYIVFIDEIDGLLTKAQRVLYTLFDWPSKPNANIILIGIANSMNLTDRFLPRLRARNCEPEMLVFPAYKKKDLKSIIEQRLKQFKKGERANDQYPFFAPVAIERVTQKVASMTGDVRRCLELCRAALEVLLDPNREGSAQVGFGEMQAVLTESFSSPTANIIKELPFHQQVMVVCASLLFRKASEISFGQLNAFYHYLTKNETLPRVRNKVEFSDMLLNITTQGILVKQKSGNRKQNVAFDISTKFSLHAQEDDVKFAVNESLKSILEKRVAIPNKFSMAL